MVPVIDDDQCNEYDWYSNSVVDGMLCAGYERGQIDSCQGDSGGPLIRKTENIGGGFQLIGIVSWGFGCAEPKKPGVYADVFFYLDWIQETVGEPNFGSFTQFECPAPPPGTTSSFLVPTSTWSNVVGNTTSFPVPTSTWNNIVQNTTNSDNGEKMALPFMALLSLKYLW